MMSLNCPHALALKFITARNWSLLLVEKMDYPQRFFSKMFAWGRPLELARRFAIYSGVILFLIAATAGIIFWAHRSQRAIPYFLHISDSGEWIVFSKNSGNMVGVMPWARLIQEAIVDKYARDYFLVPDNLRDADRLWCKCGSCDLDDKCRLCCAGDIRAFDVFTNDVLPVWRQKFGNGETLSFEGRRAVPLGLIDENGGFWRVTGILKSNKSAQRKIVAFVKTERNMGRHPETLGFHVTEFYFYGDID